MQILTLEDLNCDQSDDYKRMSLWNTLNSSMNVIIPPENPWFRPKIVEIDSNPYNFQMLNLTFQIKKWSKLVIIIRVFRNEKILWIC